MGCVRKLAVLLLMLMAQLSLSFTVTSSSGCRRSAHRCKELHSLPLPGLPIKRVFRMTYASRTRRRRFIKKSLDDFLLGCGFIYKSYWTILTKVQFPVFMANVAITVLLLACSRFFPLFHKNLLTLAWRLSIAVSVPASFYLRLYYMSLAFALLMVPIGCLSAAAIMRVLVALAPEAPKIASRAFLSSVISPASHLPAFAAFSLAGTFPILIAPAMEEVAFRWGCDKVRSCSFKSTRSKSRRLELIFSILFGLIHVSNHLPTRLLFRADLNQVSATVLQTRFLRAFAQSASACLFSRQVLFPVYRRGGLLAAFGAHATWNALVSTGGVVSTILGAIMKHMGS